MLFFLLADFLPGFALSLKIISIFLSAMSYVYPVKFLLCEIHVMTERSSFHWGFEENERSEFNRGADSYVLARRGHRVDFKKRGWLIR
jgi:hypothetical protein